MMNAGVRVGEGGGGGGGGGVRVDHLCLYIFLSIFPKHSNIVPQRTQRICRPPIN